MDSCPCDVLLFRTFYNIISLIAYILKWSVAVVILPVQLVGEN